MNQYASDRQKLESKIEFLNQQIDLLNHYLPETYQYLIEEMDNQQVLLIQLEVQERFAIIDSDSTVRSWMQYIILIRVVSLQSVTVEFKIFPARNFVR